MKISSTVTLFITMMLSFASCTSHTPKKTGQSVDIADTSDVIEVKENFQPGKIIEKVHCRQDTSMTYAVYLPTGYTADKKYPVVFAFDPHGTGKLPVSNYQELAEKYQYIIAGSNNSKNGTDWETAQKIAAYFFADVQHRFSVNATRIYLLGFSGGARIANAIAMTDGSITGVICAGAAAPANNPTTARSNYFFMGIVGNADFNYTEIKKYDKVELAGHNVKHALLVFDGKHEWPPVATMNEAFWWMELNEMRQIPSYKNDSLIKKNVQLATQQLKTDLDKKKVMDAYECCRKTINYYDGLADLTLFFNTYKDLQKNKEIDAQLKSEEDQWNKEETIKKQYIENVQSRDYNWWATDIANLNKKIKTAPKEEALIDKRVLGYLSLMMYMETTGFIKQGNIQAAVYFGNLYLLVDPTNSEAHYLMADLNATQGNQTEVIRYLKSAVQNGFEDKTRLENDTAFFKLKGNAEFMKVVAEIK